MSTVSVPAHTVTDEVASISAQQPHGMQGNARRLWNMAAIVIALGVVIFGIGFWSECTHAFEVWMASTAYGHCFLILPISAYLIWERRKALLARVPEPTFLPVIAMVPVGLVWLFAAQVGLMEGRQLMAMTLLQLFLFAVLGFPAWRVIAFALLYLYFLVPSGAFLVPALQRFAAWFAVSGIRLVGIPVYSDGFNIDVPGGNFVVAEACAGLRFLIAAVAVGTLYGYMIYNSWQRRAAFVVVSIIVPIIANGIRCFGLVVYGNYLGDAKAALADHLIYGWVFFSFVLLLLFLLGLPFRQPATSFPVTPAGAEATHRPPSTVLRVGAVSLALILLLVSPLVADGPLAAAMGSAASSLKHAIGL